MSKIVANTGAMQGTRVGTPLYLSPELVKQQPYDFKVDVWATGCVLYHVTCLEPPFKGENLIVLGNNIVSKQPDPLPSVYSSKLHSLIWRLMAKRAAERPTIAEMMKLLPPGFRKDKDSTGEDRTEETTEAASVPPVPEPVVAQKPRGLHSPKQHRESLGQDKSATNSNVVKVVNAEIFRTHVQPAAPARPRTQDAWQCHVSPMESPAPKRELIVANLPPVTAVVSNEPLKVNNAADMIISAAAMMRPQTVPEGQNPRSRPSEKLERAMSRPEPEETKNLPSPPVEQRHVPYPRPAIRYVFRPETAGHRLRPTLSLLRSINIGQSQEMSGNPGAERAPIVPTLLRPMSAGVEKLSVLRDLPRPSQAQPQQSEDSARSRMRKSALNIEPQNRPHSAMPLSKAFPAMLFSSGGKLYCDQM